MHNFKIRTFIPTKQSRIDEYYMRAMNQPFSSFSLTRPFNFPLIVRKFSVFILRIVLPRQTTVLVFSLD